MATTHTYSKQKVDNVDKWIYSVTIGAAGEYNKTLRTGGHFVAEDIGININTLAATGAALNVNDNTNSNVSISQTATNGYFSLSAAITGNMTFSQAGWVDTSEYAVTATDESVMVGKIAQSTLANGNAPIDSGDPITPHPTQTQTINITAGYENARTVVVNSMSAGTAAEATVTGSATATAPTLANTIRGQSGKDQITVTPVLESALSNQIDKYYIAVTPTAPVTNLEFTKTVDTVGYLGANTQITATAATTANSALFYLPLATGSASITMDAATATVPTLANDATATVNGKTQVTAVPTENTNTIDTFYMAVNAVAPATTVTLSKSVTEGYIKDADVSKTGGSVASNNQTFYIPLATGTTAAAAGSVEVSGTAGNVTVNAQNGVAPQSGYYITATGSGIANVNAGWFNANTSQASNTATEYYTIPQATFDITADTITVATPGYIGIGDTVGTVNAGQFTTGLTDKTSQGYTTVADGSVLIPVDSTTQEGGYLYIAPGYYEATQISLGALIPDDVNLPDAVSASMLLNYEAFDSDGNRIVGSIPTYTGAIL